MKIGGYLRKYRLDKGYSQEYLADIVGVSQKTYSNMENDKSNITLDTIRQLIELYEIDITSLDLEKFILGGKLKEAEKNASANFDSTNYNPISEKLIHQMEERISELKSINEDLKMRLKEYQLRI